MEAALSKEDLAIVLKRYAKRAGSLKPYVKALSSSEVLSPAGQETLRQARVDLEHVESRIKEVKAQLAA